MFSISKILTLIAIIGAVFTAFRLICKFKFTREMAQSQRSAGGKASRVEDLVHCQLCDRYVAAGASPDCGHGKRCPHGGSPA